MDNDDRKEHQMTRYSVQYEGSSFRAMVSQKIVTAETPQKAMEQVAAEGHKIIRCVKMPS